MFLKENFASQAVRNLGKVALTLSLATALLPSQAFGETLREALTSAYLFNPTLKAARAQLRSTDNSVAQAKSGYRPTITGTLTDGFQDIRSRSRRSGTGSGFLPIVPNPDGTGAPIGGLPLSSLSNANAGNGTGNPRSAGIALTQNVFDGFRTYNSVKSAQARVEADRENLRATEINVLLNALTFYMNVVRDQAIVNLRQNNVRVLSEQLRAARDRFKVGEVTRTDVSQAEAALSQAQADLSIAQGTLYADQAGYFQFIGHQPGSLKDPGPPTKLLPKTLDEAIAISISENPNVLAAVFNERAQEHVVKQIKGELLPSLSLSASYTKSAQVGSPSIIQQDDTQIIGQLNIPIYEAGAVSARIRAAIETQSALRHQIDVQREAARANVASAWGHLLAAKGNVAAGQAAVASTKIALQGVREEERVGQRTILDTLNSEQAALNAQVNLVSFQRDLVVSSYEVLAAMGRLTAYDIALQADLYDPNRYYNQVKDQWYGWGASVESLEDSRVAPIRDPGLKPGQSSGDGPAYTQKLPSIP